MTDYKDLIQRLEHIAAGKTMDRNLWRQTLREASEAVKALVGERERAEKAEDDIATANLLLEYERELSRREKPVIDAAVAYCTTGQLQGGAKLLAAVRAYVDGDRKYWRIKPS